MKRILKSIIEEEEQVLLDSSQASCKNKEANVGQEYVKENRVESVNDDDEMGEFEDAFEDEMEEEEIIDNLSDGIYIVFIRIMAC